MESIGLDRNPTSSGTACSTAPIQGLPQKQHNLVSKPREKGSREMMELYNNFKNKRNSVKNLNNSQNRNDNIMVCA